MTSSTRRPGNRLRLPGFLVVCGLAVAACGNSSDDGGGAPSPTAGGAGGEQAVSGAPGVTDDQIAFAALGTATGDPTGQCLLDCYVQGIEAYFAFRNDDGGVDGRELAVTKVVDDELANNQVRALEIIEANDTFGVFSITQLASGWADLADAGIPLYTWYVNAVEAAGQDSIFPSPAGVRCVDCASRLYVYASQLADATRVASIGYGVAQSSKDCVGAQAASIDEWGEDAGMELVYANDDLAFGLPNGIAPEVTAMKDADVDFILTCIDQNGAKTLAQELERQGMDDVHMLLPSGYNEGFIAESGGLFDGDVIQVPFRPYEADADGTQLVDFTHWMEETGSEPSEQAMFGWIAADLAYQGLVAAGEDLDRESVIAATNQLTDWSAGGLINPVDWSRQHEPPTDDDPVGHGPARECYAFVQVNDDGFDLATGTPAEPFVCWDPADRSWSEPEPAALQ